MKYIFTAVLLTFSCVTYAQNDEHIDSLSYKDLSYEELDSLVSYYHEKGDNKKAIIYSRLLHNTCVQEFNQLDEKCIKSLKYIGDLLAKLGQYDSAFSIISESKILAKNKLGENSQIYIDCLGSLGTIQYSKGNYKDALILFEEKLNLLNTIDEIDSIQIASAMSDLGAVSQRLGYKQKAIDISIDALLFVGKIYGTDHVKYARYQNNLGVAYLYDGQYSKTLPLFKDALKITEENFGKSHPKYALRVINLASIYSRMGQYDKALPLNLEAIALTKSLHGENHPQYARSLNNTGGLFHDMGNYEEALKYYEKAMSIRLKVFGEIHPDYVNSLNNTGATYRKLGEHDEASSLYRKSLKLRELIFGKQHSQYLRGLRNIGTHYSDLGQYEKALPLYLQCLKLSEEIFGDKHPSYALSLHNLGGLYSDLNRIDTALVYLNKATKTREEIIGKEHPNYIESLRSLGALYGKMGDYEKALSILNESQDLYQEVLSDDHPDYSHNLYNIGMIYYAMNQDSLALAYLNKALLLRVEKIGIDDQLCLKILQSLSRLNYNLSNYDKLFNSAKNINTSYKSQITNIFAFSSEYGKEKFLNKISHNFDLQSSLAYASHYAIPEMAEVIYDQELLLKGLLLEESQNLRESALSNNDTMLLKEYYKWLEIKKQISIQISKPINKRVHYYDSLVTHADELEQQLVRASSEFKANREKFNITVNDVRGNLKDGEAAIEFISFDFYNKNKTDSTMYAALVLTKDIENPAFVSLFEEKEFEPLLSSLSKYRSGASRLAYLNHLYTFSNKSLMYSQKRKSLTELIWQPLKEELKDIHTVYYASSGLLHRINLAAIPVSASENLGDKFTMVQLGSTSQLVAKDKQTEQNNKVVLYGGIQYSMDTTGLANVYTDYDSTAYAINTRRGSVSFSYTDSTLRGGNWNYLPGTKNEIEELDELLIANKFTTKSYSGHHATEESFYSIGREGASPKILHIATHGYFFPDPKETLKRGIEDEPVFKISEHPMIRSGLLLAGSEYAWEHGKSYNENMEDGILTAYEISQMDLRNTELVVLSACETGLGDIDGNEGVYGLQRAFKKAGANYLMMTLWQIADSKHTQDFMLTFYNHYIAEKKTVSEAFQLTQNEMKAKYKDPFYWAGFVLVE